MAGKYLGRGKTKTGTISETVVEGKWKAWAVGVDIHKKFAQVSVIIPDYVTGRYQRYDQKFDTDYAALRRMRDWLLEFRAEYGPTDYAIESTAMYHRPVVYALDGYLGLILVNPALIGDGKKKTDKYDAGKLAYHALTGIWDLAYISSEYQHQEKTLSRRLQKAVAGMTAASNAISTTLLDYDILLTREIKPLSQSGRGIIEAIINGEKNPEKAASAAKYYHRSTTPEAAAKYDLIQESLTDLPNLPEPVRETLEHLYNTACHFISLNERYSFILDEVIEGDSIEYDDGRTLTGKEVKEFLLTQPGVGPRFCQVYIAEMGLKVATRFKTALESCAYAGLDPSKRVSADKVVSAKSRGGNTHMHATAIQCSQGILQMGRRDNPLSKWGRAYKARNGGDGKAHNMAVAGIAKRLMISSYHIVRTGKDYNPENYDYENYKVDAAKKMRKIQLSAKELAQSIKKLEIDDAVKSIASEAIHQIGEIIGIKGGFVLNPEKPDCKIIDLDLNQRTYNVLISHDIDRVSILWFYLISGKLTELSKFGEKSYKEVVLRLKENGYLIEG